MFGPKQSLTENLASVGPLPRVLIMECSHLIVCHLPKPFRSLLVPRRCAKHSL